MRIHEKFQRIGYETDSRRSGKKYSNDCRNRQLHCEPYCIVDFISGAEWQSKQSPWISVKERLPEKPKYDWVLVTIRDKRDGFIGLPQIGELRSDGFWHTRESDDFNTEQFRREYGTTDALGIFLHQEVLAWMPIPSFDDILEENRDVLERIKEKGD